MAPLTVKNRIFKNVPKSSISNFTWFPNITFLGEKL